MCLKCLKVVLNSFFTQIFIFEIYLFLGLDNLFNLGIIHFIDEYTNLFFYSPNAGSLVVSFFTTNTDITAVSILE